MTKDIFKELNLERVRQDKTWGANRNLDNKVWLTILMEEVGESATEVLNENEEYLREELIQCGAVVIAWIENLDKNRELKSTPYELSMSEKIKLGLNVSGNNSLRSS